MTGVTRSGLTRRAATVVALAVLCLALTAGAASAAEVATASPLPAKPATATAPAPGAPYALDFTLPSFGKSGCLVCHGDLNLARNATSTIWIDQKAYGASAHTKVVCTGCHVDYGYKAPHTPGLNGGPDWRTTSKQACKNCHLKQFEDYSLGAHAIRPTSGGQPDPKAASKPLCGDCHGGHYMDKLKDNPAGKAAIHRTGEQMCGRTGCHADFWANYADYYHGAAYKAGAADAPACWDCHDTHAILSSKDRLATTNTENIAKTCGKTGCHEGASAEYEQYVPLIHSRAKVVDANPVVAFFNGIATAVGGLFGK